MEVAADKDGWKQQQCVGEQCDGGIKWFIAGGPSVTDPAGGSNSSNHEDHRVCSVDVSIILSMIRTL